MKATVKNITEKYNCDVFKERAYDTGTKYWVAIENKPKEDEDYKFEYAEGWTLNELLEDIEIKSVK